VNIYEQTSQVHLQWSETRVEVEKRAASADQRDASALLHKPSSRLMTVPPTGESPSNKHHFNGHFPCAPGLASCPCTFIPHLFLTCANDRPKLFISSSTCMPSSLPQMSCLFSSTYLHQHTTCTNTLLNHKQTLCAVHFSFHTTYGNLCTITTCFLTYSTTTCTQHIRVPSTNSPVHSVMLPTQSDTEQSLMLEATLQLL